MGIAAAAQHFRAGHEVAVVRFGPDILLLRRLPETGPSASRFELFVGPEQGCAAAGAAVHAGLVISPVSPREGALGAFPARNLVLLRRKLVPPFGVALGHFGLIWHGPSLLLLCGSSWRFQRGRGWLRVSRSAAAFICRRVAGAFSTCR